MNSSTAARIFHDWAASEGLLDDVTTASSSSAADLALVMDITDIGTQILRQKRIRAIGFDASENRIVVYTKRAAPGSKKQLGALPSRVDDVEIKYRQGVAQSIADGPPVAQAGPTYIVRTTGSTPRYTCGSSISVGNNRDAGTLCCLVRNTAGELLGLSNNHVTGGCSYAGVGLPIVAPGIYDVAPGCLSPFTLGFHSSALPLTAGSPDNVNALLNLDAAVFKLVNGDVVSSFQRDVYDTPTLTGPISGGMTVEKVGRTTGHTSGVVDSQIYGPTPITYSAPLYGFSGPVYFNPMFAIAGLGVVFSEPGDSGSLITQLDSSGIRRAVGIVVGQMNDATAPGGKSTLALPIEPILKALGVTLVGSHNT